MSNSYGKYGRASCQIKKVAEVEKEKKSLGHYFLVRMLSSHSRVMEDTSFVLRSKKREN